MNCEQVRETLRERFDAGLGLTDADRSHLDGCGGCRSYHEQLLALDAALAELPLETPDKTLAGRIQAGVAARTKQAAWTQRAVGLGIAGALAATVVLGWFYPLPVEPRLWYSEARSWAPHQVDPVAAMAQFADFTAATYKSALHWRTWIPQFGLRGPFALSSTTLWLGVAAISAALAGINGYHAANLQKMTHHSRR